ncbi:MAG: MFS transporter [Magnetococcales bacterium]|nr:MFS transporter [Magnetococcales bacterium]
MTTEPQDTSRRHEVEAHHWNALYLLSALCLILMTLAVGTQALYLQSVLGIAPAEAGTINANIMALAEALELVVIGGVGYLSDRIGRVRILVLGFLVAGVGALLASFSASIAQMVGCSGLLLYYLARLVLAAGIGAVWPQVAALAGDYTSEANRTHLLANNIFMMAFGKTLVYLILMRIPVQAGVVCTMLLIALTAFVGAWLTRRCLIDVAPRLRQHGIPWRTIGHLLRDEPRLRVCLATAFLTRSDMVITAIFLMLWYVFSAHSVGVGDAEAAAQGGMMIGLAGVMVMLSIPVWKRIIHRYGRLPAIIAGLALSGMGFVLMGLIEHPFEGWIVLPVLLAAAGQSGCFVAPQIVTVDVSPPDMLGSVLSVFNVVGSLGIIFFVQVGGVLFDLLGPSSPFVFVGLANFVVIAYALYTLAPGASPDVRPVSPWWDE